MTLTLTHRIITIAGDLGSGKSLIGNLLAEKTGYKFYSTGWVQREIASRHGITTLELNKRSETTFEYDEEIDAFTKQLSETGEAFFMDSRMAWYFLPESFKIYFHVDSDIAAERIFQDNVRKNEKYASVEAAKKAIRRRQESELYRFKTYYNQDLEDERNYDLIIDTSHSKPEEITSIILDNLSPAIPPDYKHKYWFPPKILHSTIAPEGLNQETARRLEEEIKTNGYDNRFAVVVERKDDSLYILEEHERVRAALSNNISLIPATITIPTP